jgi:hypothetical protein
VGIFEKELEWYNDRIESLDKELFGEWYFLIFIEFIFLLFNHYISNNLYL